MASEPKFVLGLDFETQDADAKTTRITEIGAVLFTVIENRLKPLCDYNRLVYEPDYPPQTKKIIELTGITDDMLIAKGISRKEALRELITLIDSADIIMAHKISFDKTVLYSSAKLFDLVVPEKEWLCTLTNFNWPSNLTCHKLSHLAYEHGIMVDPRTLHRAFEDVALMGRVVNEYSFSDVIKYAREPWIYLKADVIAPWKDGGFQTGVAKSLGYSWQQVKGVDFYQWDKTWVTRVKESMFEAHKEEISKSIAPFRITKIEGIS